MDLLLLVNLALVPIQGEYQHQIRCYDSRALKVYGLPALIFQVVNLQHCRVGIVGSPGEEGFEVGKERGVVECPFRSFLANRVNVATWGRSKDKITS